MYIGQLILVKHNNLVQEGNIEQILAEDLEIKLLDGTLIKRKFWEIHKIEKKNEE